MKKHLSIGDCFEITKQGTATFSLEKYHNSIFYHLFASIPISKANQTYDSQYEFFIPEGVKTLSKAAFQLPHLFGEITLPSSLKTIGSDFFNNANVTKVTLQNDCVLNSNSFNGATDLSKFETNVYKINLKGPNHFLSTSISHINLDGIFLSPNPNDNKRSFSNTKLTHVTIPHHWKMIPEGMFVNCKNLEALDLSHFSGEIGVCAFANCPHLKHIIWGKGDYDIEESAFFNCPNIMDLDFSTTANVTLGKDCFVDCSNITKFVMPASGILKTKFHDVAFRTTFSPIKSIIFDQKYKTITHPFWYNQPVEQLVLDNPNLIVHEYMINVLSPEHLIIKTIHPFSTNLLPNPWSSSSLQRYHYYSKKTISVTDINLLLAPQALFGNLGERALTEIPDYTISKLEVPSENLDWYLKTYKNWTQVIKSIVPIQPTINKTIEKSK